MNGYVDNVNRMSQSLMEVKNGPITRAQRRKLKALEDNDMLEGFEGQERASKLFSMCSISKDQTKEQIGGEIASWKGLKVKKRASKLFSMCSISKDQIREHIEEKLAKSLKGATLPLIVALTLPSPVVFCRHKAWKMLTYHAGSPESRGGGVERSSPLPFLKDLESSLN
ncbi:hypothetical protein M9H77_02390 [Catharanthus roseus]|uniref:Uncharacterized protein n=1 Tax=Catharanthus roseus TaxID=4058 RepID=A0ACC0C8S2_CATRO|nr:hypothetical protein M9H77_02390 [Catharanthus roseus]